MDEIIELILNGEKTVLPVLPGQTLLDALRENLQMTGAKYGCGEGQCGACTVLADGRPIRSCLTPAAGMSGRTVLTIEGLAKDGALHPVQEAFIAEGAMQCGYCVPGMILNAVGLLEQNPNPSDEQIVEAMNGNLCRCCNYPSLMAAIRRAARSGKVGQVQ